MKNKLVYLFLIITAILIGHLLGLACASVADSSVSWLGHSLNFGFDTTTLNLSAITVSFGLQVSICPMQILCILIALLLAPKVAASIK
ncbi:MAG: DUF4321 domain-containing protein [Oscillospiraceae bacterium]|nr:DUF4321 domain-containing protein [Oscillospiraceae bacterium]